MSSETAPTGVTLSPWWSLNYNGSKYLPLNISLLHWFKPFNRSANFPIKEVLK